MKTRRLSLAAAFLLPVGLYMTVLLAARVIPFGNNSLLLWDANHFYAEFLEYWRGVLLGRPDAFYSLHRALGQSMAGLTTFFLLSPLNALLLLFPENAMPLFYSVLILLKIGLCGLTFLVFLRKRYQSGRVGLLFSTAYALSGFVAAYAFHVMWLDALILLPLVALGVHRVAEGEKPFLYIAALGLTLITQYYIGYMICLFSALYFAYEAGQNGGGWKTFLRRLPPFIASSLLAAGLAAAVLIPALYAVTRGYTLFDPEMLTVDRVNSVFGVLTKLFTASSGVAQERSGGPNLYIGVPLLAFTALYFACRSIPLRKRLWSLGFLAVFGLSFLFATPYYVWHAFNAPNFFPARFSFLCSFLMLELSWQGFTEIAAAPRRRALAAASAATAGFLALTAVVLSRIEDIEYLAVRTVSLDAAFFCLACFLALWLRKPRMKTAAVLAVCAMQAVCLLLNAYYPIVRLNQVWSAAAGEYTEETGRGRELVERVRADDPGLYRMEFDFHRTDTDPFVFDYNGLTHFSPDADATALAFLDRLGLKAEYYHVRYAAGASPVMESLFGLKYILKKDGVAFEDPPEGYTFLWRGGDAAAYENTYALPLAYLAPEQTMELSDADPFLNQNTLLSDLTGVEAAVFEPVADVKRTYDGTWETYTFTAQANRPLYMKSFGAEYTLNGVSESGDRMNGTILLPIAETDTTYEVKMTGPPGVFLAYFDLGAFRRAQAILAAHAAAVESDKDSHFIIHVNVTDEHRQLLITIPYDVGWRALVDGKPAETTARYGALLAVNLTEGAHTVELRFTPVGFRLGAGISAASLLAVLSWALLQRPAKRRRDA